MSPILSATKHHLDALAPNFNCFQACHQYHQFYNKPYNAPHHLDLQFWKSEVQTLRWDTTLNQGPCSLHCPAATPAPLGQQEDTNPSQVTPSSELQVQSNKGG